MVRTCLDKRYHLNLIYEIDMVNALSELGIVSLVDRVDSDIAWFALRVWPSPLANRDCGRLGMMV